MRELETSLQQFGEFLLRARLASERAAPYCVRWVRRFLMRAASDEPLADQVRRFCEELERDDRCQEWQVRQAEQALRLYFVNFLRRTDWHRQPTSTVVDEHGQQVHCQLWNSCACASGLAITPIEPKVATWTGCSASSPTWPSATAYLIPWLTRRRFATFWLTWPSAGGCRPAPRIKPCARSCFCAARYSASTSRTCRLRPTPSGASICRSC